MLIRLFEWYHNFLPKCCYNCSAIYATITIYIFHLLGEKFARVSLLQLHIVSSGLKAYVTYEVAKGIEICRLSCGGHGYSQASGLPELYGNAVGGCTYEGDNIVMFLQVAR